MTSFEQLKMHSPNLVDANIDKIASLFPNCITEAWDEFGNLKKAIDFDLLRQELSHVLVEGDQERYRLDWPGKKEAILTANAPIAKTLRPCREESVNFDTTQNLFIEGDNLDALKLLQENYLGKVKMIYIDPPYNTGNDFIYNDDFAESTEDFFEKSHQIDEEGNRLLANKETDGRYHSKWLSMMYSRLKLARNLLKDDGVFIISIDENELHNLKNICSEIFGDNNYIGEIIWKNSSKNDQKFISIQHEYVLVYVKNKILLSGDWLEKKEGLDEIYSEYERLKKKFGNNYQQIHIGLLNFYKSFPDSHPIKDNKHYSWADDNGVYFPSDISGPNDGQYVYDIKHPITQVNVKRPSRGWNCPKPKLLELIQIDKVHFGQDETTVPCLKTYLKDTEYKSLTSILYKDGRVASKKIASFFGEKVFTNPKDIDVLKKIMDAMDLSDNDLVMDFFAGSGSFGEAVFLYNEINQKKVKFILVQINENLEKTILKLNGLSKKVTQNAIDYLIRTNKKPILSELTKERLRLVKSNYPSSDIGFRVLKVDSSNMKDVYYTPDSLKKANLDFFESNIKEDRTDEDLLFQVMLDWGLELSLPIEPKQIADKTVYFVAENSLVACFQPLSMELIDQIAQYKPLRFVSAERSIVNDHDKTNIRERFKQLSPETDVKFL